MAFHLETSEQLLELKLQLEKGGARALKILKHVEFQLKTERNCQEFIVNKWPNPTVVLQKTTRSSMCSFVAGSCVVYTTTPNNSVELDEFFEHDILDWSEPWTFAGTARDLYDKLADIASRKGAGFEPAEEMIVANTLEFKRSVQEKPLPEGYYFSGRIKSESEKAKVNSSWKFGGDETSMGFVKLNSENMESCGVKDKDGNLIGFELQTCYGSVAMLHVDPEHRGKGIGTCIMTKMVKTLQDDGQQVYCHIEVMNDASYRLHTKFGFELAEGGQVMWVRSFPRGCSSCKKNKSCCT